MWAGIAELLNIPSITIARMVKSHDGKVIVERCVTDGIEILEADTPALVTFTNEGNDLRNVSLAALMKVKKMEIQKWSASDVGFEKSRVMDMTDLYRPDLGDIDCYMVPGESPLDKGRNLGKWFTEENF